MLKKGLFLLLLINLLSACTQERPATFTSSNERAELAGNSSQPGENQDIQTLMNAIMNGDIKEVESLVSEENINNKDDLGNTALMVAVQYMDTDIIKFLLEKGADPTMEDSLGVSSITMALESEDKELINLLKTYTSK